MSNISNSRTVEMHVKHSYSVIPDDADSLDKSDMDIPGLEPHVSGRENKGSNYFAYLSGAIVVVLVVLLFASRNAFQIFNNKIAIYQTSLLWSSDRLTALDSSAMRDRGFDVGTLSFGNTDCSEIVKAFKSAQGYVCHSPQRDETAQLHVDKNKRYQSILGFGGAFTEASAINFYKFPEKIQQQIIKAYFGDEGIGYTLGRVPINSCDFSEASYSFDEVAGDYDLLFFDDDLTHDMATMIPFLRQAREASSNRLRILASPWSPPKWMKKPVHGVQSMNGSAVPRGLKEDAATQATWAKYISRWISSYRQKGVPIWAITPQNEPEFAAPWEACAWDDLGQRDWIARYLGPTLKEAHPHLLVFGYDHNKEHMLNWANTLLGADSASAEWVDGMAFHWYTGGDDRMLDGTFGHNEVNKTHHQYPNKLLLATEGCSCPDIRLGDWKRAEILAHDVMFDLLNSAQGWIDWNLIVDSQGGINHLHNYCDAAFVAKPDFSDVIVQPKYYYMGHVSKFVPPGSTRIHSEIVGNFRYNESIDARVRTGYELSAWPCERSPRQLFTLTTDGYLALANAVIDEEAQRMAQSKTASEGSHKSSHHTSASSGSTTPETATLANIRLCVKTPTVSSNGVPPLRPYLHVIPCERTTSQASIETPSKFVYDAISGGLRDVASGLCVSLAEGVRESGALLALEPCQQQSSSSVSEIDEHQSWTMNSNTGEITVLNHENDEGLCMTVGWPMLTAVAFQRPTASSRQEGENASLDDDGATVVVVMNEASCGTHITLSDPDQGAGIGEGSAWFGISGNSIQTIIY